MSDIPTFSESLRVIRDPNVDPEVKFQRSEDFVSSVQGLARSHGHGDGGYLLTMDGIEDKGDELRAEAYKEYAKTKLAPLGASRANAAWESYLGRSSNTLDEAQTKALGEVDEFIASHQPSYGERESFNITESGANKGSSRSMGGVALRQRPSGYEAIITQTTDGLDIKKRAFDLDSNVDNGIRDEGLKIEALQQDIERLSKPSGFGLGGDFGNAALSRGAADSILASKDKIRRYGGSNGVKEYAIDQIDAKIKTDYSESFGKEANLSSVGETVARGFFKFGSNIDSGLIKISGIVASKALGAVGGITGSEAIKNLGKAASSVMEEASEEVLATTERDLKHSFIGLERARGFTGSPTSQVLAAAAEEAPGLAMQIGVGGGLSRIGAGAALSSVGSASLGGLREASGRLQESRDAMDVSLGKHLTIKEARDAGDDESAEKAQEIMDAGDAVFMSALATTTVTDLPIMARFIGRGAGVISRAKRKLSNKALSVITTGVQEGLTEVGQDVLNNKWAKELYDENRDVFPSNTEMTKTFAVGLILGIAGDAAVSGGRSDVSTMEEVADFKLATQKAILARRDEFVIATKENRQLIDQLDADTPPIADQPRGVDAMAEQVVKIADQQVVTTLNEADTITSDLGKLNQAAELQQKIVDLNIEDNESLTESDEVDLTPLKKELSDAQAVESTLKREIAGIDAEKEAALEGVIPDLKGKKRIAAGKAIRDKAKAGVKKAREADATRAQSVRDARKGLSDARKTNLNSKSSRRGALNKERDELRDLKSRIKQSKSDVRHAPKNMRNSFLDSDPVAFIQSAMSYMMGTVSTDGSSVLTSAFGNKTEQFEKWATNKGKFALNSEEAAEKIKKGMTRYGQSGNAPIKGMENEFESLRQLTEPMYRMARKNDSRAPKKDSKIQDLSNSKREFATLFADKTKRADMDELKTGEVSSTRSGYIRVATKSGSEQKVKSELNALAMKSNLEKRGGVIRLEETPEGFYVVRPILTPDGNARLIVADSLANLEPQILPGGQFISSPRSANSVRQLADNRRDWRLTTNSNDEHGALATYRENSYLGRQQATGEAGAVNINFKTDVEGRIIGLTAKNGEDSTFWPDVASSIAKGEDLYDASDEVVASLAEIGAYIDQIAQMGADAGVQYAFIDDDVFTSENLNIKDSGIHGYIPRSVDKKASIENGLTEAQYTLARKPSKIKGFEKKRRYESAKEMFEKGGLITKTPRATVLDYGIQVRQKISDQRLLDDPRIAGKVVDTTKGRAFTTKILGKTIEFEDSEARSKFDKMVKSQHGQPDSKMIRGMLEANRQLKTTKVGVDFGVITVFGVMLAANSPKAFMDATWESTVEFFKPGAWEQRVRDQDLGAVVTDMGKHGTALNPDIDFVASREESVWLDKAINIPFKIAGMKNGPRVIQRFGESFRAFLSQGSVSMWQGMTEHLPKNARGQLTPEAEEDGRAIADHINRSLGKFDMQRHGVTAGQSLAASMLSFAPQLVAGQISMLYQAARPNISSDANRARFALSKYAAGYYAFSAAGMMLAGLNDDEIKKRLNPLLSGSRFLSIPVPLGNGAVMEVGLGGTYLATIKLLSEWSRSAFSGMDIFPEKFQNPEKGVLAASLDPIVKFANNRKSPLLSVAINGLKMTNHFNEPVPPAEFIIDSFFPLAIEDSSKIATKKLGDYLAPKTGSGLILRADEIYIDENDLKKSVSRFVLKMVGSSVYTPSQNAQRNHDLDSASVERYGVTYDDLSSIGQMAEVTGIVESQPEFKERPSRVFRDQGRLKKTAANYNKNNAAIERQFTRRLSIENKKLILSSMPSIPPIAYSVQHNFKDIKLSAAQQKRLMKETASKVDDRLTELRADPEWQASSNEWKARNVSKVVNSAFKRVLGERTWVTSGNIVTKKPRPLEQ